MANLSESDIVASRPLEATAPEALLVLDVLEQFLDERGIGSGAVVAEPLGDGHSNITYLIRRGSLEVVLRRPPRPPLPPGAHDMVREARLLEALANTSVPVPEVLAVAESNETLGAPFYITSKVEGVVVTTAVPPIFETPSACRSIIECLVDTLIEIHSVDVAAVGLDHVAKRDGYLVRQIRLFERLWSANKTRQIPAVEAIGRWLTAQIPQTKATTLVHGDYRLGNAMFASAMPVRVAAIFDWEMATLGDPLADVGYFVATYARLDDFVNPLASLAPVTTSASFPDRAELAALYEERSGRSVRRLDWYVVLALWKTIIFMEGNYRRALAGASDDAFALEFGAIAADVADQVWALARSSPDMS